MSETLLGLVVLAAVGGAILNTIRGWHNSGEKYDIKKGVTSLIPSVFAGIVIGQNVFTALPDGVGFLTAILLAITAGFGIDFAVTRGKKE